MIANKPLAEMNSDELFKFMIDCQTEIDSRRAVQVPAMLCPGQYFHFPDYGLKAAYELVDSLPSVEAFMAK